MKKTVEFTDENQTTEILPEEEGGKVFMTVKDDTDNSIFRAKNMSKAAMAFSSIWIAVLTILKGLKIIDLDIWEVSISGLAICAPWSPTYVSTWLDKIKDIRFGYK